MKIEYIQKYTALIYINANSKNFEIVIAKSSFPLYTAVEVVKCWYVIK